MPAISRASRGATTWPTSNGAWRSTTGDLLDGLVLREALYDEWLLGAQHHFRRTACDVIERLASGLADVDRLDEAVDALDRRVAMDSACESAHRSLMEIFERMGRRSDALRQYQFLTDALSRELGTAPSPETTVVYERIRTGGGGSAQRVSSPPEEAAVDSEHDLPAARRGTRGPDTTSGRPCRRFDVPMAH